MREKSSSPLIIGHRGASAIAPENTLAAFRRAIESGAEGLEFDVRLTKTHVPVVFHDSFLRRICRQNLRVSDLTVNELKDFDAGSWFNETFPKKAVEKFAEEKIPTLRETLNLLKDFKGLIYIELKCLNREIKPSAEAVAEIVKESPLFSQIIVKSFKLKAIREIKRLVPEIRTAALFAPKITTVLRKKSRMIDEALKHDADEMSLHYSLATKNFVEKISEAGMETIIWTADSPVWIKRARENGIKAIITNNPANLLAKRLEDFGE